MVNNGQKGNSKMDKEGCAIVIIVAFFVIALAFAAGRGAFLSENDAIMAAEKQGYSNVEVREKHIFFIGLRGAGNDDAALFQATATNPAGQKTDILICMGWPFKGATIRTK